VSSREDCLAHGRKHSKTYDAKAGEFYKSSPWATSEESMCLKTVLIQLAKTLPLSVEVQKAIDSDESTRHVSPVDIGSGKIHKVLDLPSQTNWNAGAEKESGESEEDLKKSLDAQAAKES
jgi:recombinational DNA repair protein RecT